MQTHGSIKLLNFDASGIVRSGALRSARFVSIVSSCIVASIYIYIYIYTSEHLLLPATKCIAYQVAQARWLDPWYTVQRSNKKLQFRAQPLNYLLKK